MRPISSSGSVSPLAQRAQPQQKSAQPVNPQPSQQFTPAAAPAKNPAPAIKRPIHEPYMLGNAFDNYESPKGR